MESIPHETRPERAVVTKDSAGGEKEHPASAFLASVTLAFLVGLIVDKVITADGSGHSFLVPYPSDLRFGFFVILPLTLSLLLIFFKRYRVRQCLAIIGISALSFTLVGLFGIWFYEFRLGRSPSDMYSVVYFIAPIIAVPIGILFGLYLCRVMRRSSVDFPVPEAPTT